MSSSGPSGCHSTACLSPAALCPFSWDATGMFPSTSGVVVSSVSYSHYCCSHAVALMALNLPTLYFSLGEQGEQVPLGWDSCTPFLFLLRISCNGIPKNNQIKNQQACNTHPGQTVPPKAWWAGIKHKFPQNSSWLKLFGYYGTLWWRDLPTQREHPTMGTHYLSSHLAAQRIFHSPYLSLYFNTHALLSLLGW